METRGRRRTRRQSRTTKYQLNPKTKTPIYYHSKGKSSSSSSTALKSRTATPLRHYHVELGRWSKTRSSSISNSSKVSINGLQLSEYSLVPRFLLLSPSYLVGVRRRRGKIPVEDEEESTDRKCSQPGTNRTRLYPRVWRHCAR